VYPGVNRRARTSYDLRRALSLIVTAQPLITNSVSRTT
jgi:hypothetical protein